MLSGDFGGGVDAEFDEVDRHEGFLGAVDFHHSHLLPAVVAHALATGLIEVLTQEVQLHLPPTQVRLLAVVQDRVERMQVLVFART